MPALPVRPFAVAFGAALLALGLAGCGGPSVTFGPAGSQGAPGPTPTGVGEDGGVSVSGGGVSVSGGPGGVKVEAPGATVSGGPGGVQVDADTPAPGGAAGGKVIIGSGADRLTLSVDTSVASSVEEVAAANAYRRYYEVWTRGAHDGTINAVALHKVASGQAAGDALKERADGTRLVGDLAIDVASVDVNGTTATITACLSTQLKQIDAEGTQVDDAVFSGQTNADVKRIGSAWKVVTAARDTSDSECS